MEFLNFGNEEKSVAVW